MAWLQRLFGLEKPENAEVNPTPQPISDAEATAEDIPPERLGLNGEYDQSGLAKRVALAFDEDPELTDFDRLWVAQLGTTVVLKGEVPDQEILDKMVAAASSVNGTTDVNTEEVSVG
ncbi:MAG: phospholipid-binding protein [Sphaerospermopsis sp. SIO1G2]|nr:phospholipid-binding protein [Sphaerospermopsis sp. SIO1G1]NET69493.1 phospholipid-binding protein [Sphaerospermopsis sp. SIO1G2]